MSKTTEIKPMYKYELAQIIGVSRKQLMNWVNDSETEKRLFEFGYKNQKMLTLKQVEIILQDLGEIDEYERVPIKAYTKNELCGMYGISKNTLLSQIYSIPDRKAVKTIMDGNDSHIFLMKKYKIIFKKSEVELIFKWLGHPYKHEKIHH